MRLAFPSLVLFVYTFVSLVWPLHYQPLTSVAAGIVLFLISLKYIIYVKIGGSFIAPNLARYLLVIMEVLYSAMVILFFLLLVKDFLALLFWLSRWMGSSYNMPFTPVTRSGGLVIAALAFSLFGTWQAVRVPSVHTVEITTPGLPDGLDDLSIVQLSDLHIGPLLRGRWLRDVVEKTNGLAPHLVVLTGDMIDGSPEDLHDDVAPLNGLRAQYGVYGITGNHEYYFDADRWISVFESLGIVMLNNDYRSFSIGDGELVLLGVPDETSLHFGKPGPNLGDLLKEAPAGVRVLLQHRPSGGSGKEGVDLQLSGHTHGGHLFFLKRLIASFNGGFIEGLFDLDGMTLYVSPGTGIWSGFLCRLGVPAEITRIILRQQKNA